METNTYNDFVDRMNFVPQTREYLAIALGGEVGEVLNEIKKEIRPNSLSRRDNIGLEIGDSLYYLTALAKRYGFSLEEIMRLNIDKLEKRRLETGVPK